MSLKVILLSLGVVVLAGAGYGAYRYFGSSSDKVENSAPKITGKQATTKNVTVTRADISPGATNFSSDQAVVIAGYTAPVAVIANSTVQMEKVALEELKINNLDASGDCTVTDKDASVSTFIPGMGQMGYINFTLSCRTGVTYTVDSVLSTGSEWSGMKLLSYAGITPASLSRSLSFDVAIKFQDGTMTKKTFSGTISGQKLFNGDFGAGTLSGLKETF
ncbi:MAG: hypothetical protein WCI57_03295 [Candidatus Berkelbacteria bacterium]